MTDQTDFLRDAIKAFAGAMDAFDRSESATSERSSAASLHVSDRLGRTAQTLALLSLAQDVRRVADAMESVVEHDSEEVIASAVRIWGSAA